MSLESELLELRQRTPAAKLVALAIRQTERSAARVARILAEEHLTDDAATVRAFAAALEGREIALDDAITAIGARLFERVKKKEEVGRSLLAVGRMTTDFADSADAALDIATMVDEYDLELHHQALEIGLLSAMN